MTDIESHKKIHYYSFLVIGFAIILLLNFVPPTTSSSSYNGPTNVCIFDCEGVDQGPYINRVNSTTSHGFPFTALYTKHQTNVNGAVTFSSYKAVDWHNVGVDIVFVIISDLVIASVVYLVYSSNYKKKRSANK